MGQTLKTDWILFSTVVVMVSFGILILYSASSVMAQIGSALWLELAFCGAPGSRGRPRL